MTFCGMQLLNHFVEWDSLQRILPQARMEQHIAHIPLRQWLHQGSVMQAVCRFDYFLYGTEQVAVFHTGQTVFEDGTLLVVFLDGTEIECKNDEE